MTCGHGPRHAMPEHGGSETHKRDAVQPAELQRRSPPRIPVARLALLHGQCRSAAPASPRGMVAAGARQARPRGARAKDNIRRGGGKGQRRQRPCRGAVRGDERCGDERCPVPHALLSCSCIGKSFKSRKHHRSDFHEPFRQPFRPRRRGPRSDKGRSSAPTASRRPCRRRSKAKRSECRAVPCRGRAAAPRATCVLPVHRAPAGPRWRILDAGRGRRGMHPGRRPPLASGARHAVSPARRSTRDSALGGGALALACRVTETPTRLLAVPRGRSHCGRPRVCTSRLPPGRAGTLCSS